MRQHLQVLGMRVSQYVITKPISVRNHCKMLSYLLDVWSCSLTDGTVLSLCPIIKQVISNLFVNVEIAINSLSLWKSQLLSQDLPCHHSPVSSPAVKTNKQRCIHKYCSKDNVTRILVKEKCRLWRSLANRILILNLFFLYICDI